MSKKSDYIKILYLAKKTKAINYLGGKCECCGETDIFKLCFHHNNSDDKEKNINELRNYRWSIIQKELKKCSLLCQNCHSDLHFNNDKINRYKNNKKLYLEYKNVNNCEYCGYDKCLSSLDFHHIDKNKKDFIISRITISYNNVEDFTHKMTNELDKCVVICKNCHILEHSDVDFYNKNKEEILFRSNNIKEIQKKLDIEKIKELYYGGMKQIEIANHFNASKGTISGIIKKIKNNVT